MKRLLLSIGTLLFTFAIGISANALVLRAAYHFIPDFDPQPRAHCTLRASLTEISNGHTLDSRSQTRTPPSANSPQ